MGVMTVLQTMWDKAMIVRIRARRVFVFGVVLANLSLVALPRALALDPDRRISQYGHTVWRIQDGAISPPTNIAQTTDGFIWITTAQGLLRFDGVRFIPWQPPQGQNLPGTHFTAVLGSRDGSLWIGTTRGLARWKDGQLRTYTDLEHYTGITAIDEDDSGTIWATRYGLNAREAPLCSVSGETLRCFGKKDGIPVTFGQGLTHDSDGYVWFGSKVLVRWRPGTTATTYFGEIPEPAKGDGVNDVVLGPSGTAWASFDQTGPQLGVRYYSGGKWASYAVQGFDGTRVHTHALLVDRRGSLWVGTENDGLYRICGGVADHYGVSDGLSGNSVGSLFEDREGNIWLTTDGGLDMFRDTALISYTTRQGVSDSQFHSVMTLRNGAVWIGTRGALYILRKQDGKTAIFDRKLSGKAVGPMLEDHSGAVWLGSGLTLMRFQNGRSREIGGQRFASFGGVSGIAEDPGGTIWVLTRQKNQLFSIVGDKIEKQASPDYEFGWLKFLVADPNGGVWLGTQYGKSTISYFRGGRLQTTSLSSSQGPAGIRALFVDSDNSLLVPSSEGLYRLNHGQLTLFSSDNGLPCPETFSAIRDNHGALWIYTRCGMVRIAESEWAKWIENPHGAVSVMILDALDGAQAGTGSSSQPVSSKAPDGRLWFVTGVSAQVLDPDHLYENALPPPVYVEGVVADHKRLDATSSVKVPALSRDLEIDYTAPSFSVPQKVLFRYMLEGRDREWLDAGTRRQAFYTDLEPGHYRFRVTACNSHGVWNQTGASLDFVVLPAYYQTWWFRALCVAAFLALLWGLYQFRLRQLARQFNIRLEERVNERTRIARDLHDTMLQTFQGMLLKFYGLSFKLADRPEAQQELEGLLEQGQQAINEGRDAVQGLRASTVIANDLARAFTTLGEELAAKQVSHNPVAFDVEVESETRDLHPILRDEVHRIACEALRNAFQHSGAARIEVRIHYDDRQFRVCIRDDGKGIDPKVLDAGGREGHYGLTGMHERAKLAGGRLVVRSGLNSGTEAEIIIPAAQAYAKTRSPRRSAFLRTGA
jgi:signal transduction histidine kinase/ligand-binding sensor domain-containing protein